MPISKKKKKGEKGKKEKRKKEKGRKKKEIGNPKRRHETNGIGLSIMRMLLFLSHPENKNCVCGKRTVYVVSVTVLGPN